MNESYKPLPKGAKVILSELAKGKTKIEVSQQTGYSLKTIANYMSIYCEKNKKTEKIVERIKSGKKQSQIAKEFFVSRQYISKLKKVWVKND